MQYSSERKRLQYLQKLEAAYESFRRGILKRCLSLYSLSSTTPENVGI